MELTRFRGQTEAGLWHGFDGFRSGLEQKKSVNSFATYRSITFTRNHTSLTFDEVMKSVKICSILAYQTLLMVSMASLRRLGSMVTLATTR